jgi:hypothetical protein
MQPAGLPPEQVEVFDRRHDQLLGRLGGDRFVILTPDHLPPPGDRPLTARRVESLGG